MRESFRANFSPSKLAHPPSLSASFTSSTLHNTHVFRNESQSNDVRYILHIPCAQVHIVIAYFHLNSDFFSGVPLSDELFAIALPRHPIA